MNVINVLFVSICQMTEVEKTIAGQGDDRIWLIEDLTNDENLLAFFQGVVDYSVYPTIAGINYLKESYGYQTLAQTLLKMDSRFPYENRVFTPSELVDWIRDVEEYVKKMQDNSRNE